MSVIKVHENVDEIERAHAPRVSDHQARDQSCRTAARVVLRARSRFGLALAAPYFALDNIYFELTNC